MKNIIFSLVVYFISSNVFCQKSNFDFYGNAIDMKNLSPLEYDSLIKYSKVPTDLLQYINTNIVKYGLEDWSIVLFLKSYTNAVFKNSSNTDKVRFYLV